jgi:predicted ATPase
MQASTETKASCLASGYANSYAFVLLAPVSDLKQLAVTIFKSNMYFCCEMHFP